MKHIIKSCCTNVHTMFLNKFVQAFSKFTHSCKQYNNIYMIYTNTWYKGELLLESNRSILKTFSNEPIFVKRICNNIYVILYNTMIYLGILFVTYVILSLVWLLQSYCMM